MAPKRSSIITSEKPMMELSGVRIEHDPEKWEPVFGQDHAQTNWWLILASA